MKLWVQLVGTVSDPYTLWILSQCTSKAYTNSNIINQSKWNYSNTTSPSINFILLCLFVCLFVWGLFSALTRSWFPSIVCLFLESLPTATDTADEDESWEEDESSESHQQPPVPPVTRPPAGCHGNGANLNKTMVNYSIINGSTDKLFKVRPHSKFIKWNKNNGRWRMGTAKLQTYANNLMVMLHLVS